MVIMAIQDRAKVEEFRKKIGLMLSLEDYLKFFEKDGKKVRFAEE